MARALKLPEPPDTSVIYGHATPRIGPPVPARSQVKELEAAARDIKVTFIPWQAYLGRFTEALGPDDLWLYPEVAGIVSRQQGKTTFILPHIMRRLKLGRRVLHAGNQRELPRLTFNRLAPLVEARFPDAKVRRGAGQETIEIPSTGGVYRITAASSGGPRGWSMDDLIVDEVREIGEDFIQAAMPTLAASVNPQTLYLSNAGHDLSKVLNDIRARAQEDPSLAYLEWSASPERPSADRDGWLEANPAIGHLPGIIKYLDRVYQSHKMAGTLTHFETENLCRWVSTMRQNLVDASAWLLCKGDPGTPVRASIAVSMDPHGKRASVAVAWQFGEGMVGLRLLENVTGDPIDTDDFGKRVKALATGKRGVAGDPLTDAELLKYVTKPKPRKVTGNEYAAASAQFVNLVNAGKVRWADADQVTDDLTWTSRKSNGDDGSYHAVRALDDRPITASLAAIRAVWLASGPVPASAKVL